MKKRIYLDYAASTPIDTKVLEVMMSYLKKEWGNPSSAHWFGQKARAAIERAREQAARFLNCDPLEIIFTSGATESNNLAIQGIAAHYQLQHSVSKSKSAAPHIVISAIEHESLLGASGEFDVSRVPVTKEGFVRPRDVEQAIKPNTILVSVQYANSEIGTIQPIREISKIARGKALFHTDAVQAANYLPCDVQKLGVDMLTLSAHKIYGPKGVGLLYVKKGIQLTPLVKGGGQEFDMRGGTENVAGIAGFGQALENLQSPKMPVTNIKVRRMRDRLVKGILGRIADSKLTGQINEQRLPNNAHVRFKGVLGKDLVFLLDQKGVAVSTGSACSEKLQQASHVLTALGLPLEEAASSVRITVGKYTTAEEIEKTLKILSQAILYARTKNI